MKKILFATSMAIIAMAFSLNSSIATAGSVTAKTQATATIAKACSISASNVSFGNLDLTQTQTNANGTINILCSNKTSYTIGMTYGTPATAGYYTNGQPDTGLMTGAVSKDVIAYGFQSGPINNNNAAWGRSSPVTGTGTGSMQTVTMYGEAQLASSGPGGQYVSRYPTPDNYSDTVTLTLTY
jgi:spore coat protein U-like protein